MSTSVATLDKIVALCKRRGFAYQTADIYGGLNGVYDFGHLGTVLRENLRTAWRTSMRAQGLDILFLEGSLLGPHSMWEASGHVEGFHDPMVDCLECKKRFRADEIDMKKGCPHCGKNNWTDIRQFNMMFKTAVGASQDNSAQAYLRPETAQTIFVNFKNVLSSNRVKVPFGIAQMGKAFRNEITPRQFLFRMREFEQMEMEFFCKAEDVNTFFEQWTKARHNFFVQELGVSTDRIRIRPHEKNELAHYSTKCNDIEYEFPFGWKELEGIADRGDYDLSKHTQHSGKDLAVFDDATKTSYMPHVVECSIGTDRLFLTVLFDAYDEDTLGGEARTVLKLHPRIAPVKAAFLPLSKKLNDQARPAFAALARTGLAVEFDDGGSIGKRYRRQDEIGTPVCFTYDFDSVQDNCVTARNRDTLTQERISIDTMADYIANLMKQ